MLNKSGLYFLKKLIVIIRVIWALDVSLKNRSTTFQTQCQSMIQNYHIPKIKFQQTKCAHKRNSKGEELEKVKAMCRLWGKEGLVIDIGWCGWCSFRIGEVFGFLTREKLTNAHSLGNIFKIFYEKSN